MLFITQKGFNTRKALLKYLFVKKNVITYIDADLKKIDVEKGASNQNGQIFRSITDLHKIVRSQFPKTKFESTVRIISELIESDRNIALIWCNHISKVVVKYTIPQENSYLTNYSKKNYYQNKGIDGYSLKDYIEIIENQKK